MISAMRVFCIIFLCVTFSPEVFPQPVETQAGQKSLDISFLFGHYALIDEIISGRQYSGNLSGWAINWTTGSESRQFRLGFSYARGNRIRNYNVVAEVQNFTLSTDWLFRTAPIRLLSRKGAIYLGPSLLLFYHNREQMIAQTPLESSALGMASLNLSGRAAFRIISSLNFSSDFRVAVLSFTGKTTESIPGEEKASNLRLLSGFSAADVFLRLSMEWTATRSLALGFSYSFDWKRTTAWDYYRSLADIFTVKAGIRF